MGRRVVAIIIALVVALFGAFGVVAYAQGADARAVAGQATQGVYFSKLEVPMGTSAADAVAQNLIVRQQVVSRGVPAGALTDVSAATGALVATSAIQPGEVVLASRFGAMPHLTKTEVIPAGMIAITVSLTDPQRIAPLLTPQSRIVIFDTSTGVASKSGAAVGKRLTRILLSDVDVIGVGDLTAQAVADPAQAGKPAGTPALVTVALSPANAQLLVHEIQAGNLLYGGLLGTKVKVDTKHVVNDATILAH